MGVYMQAARKVGLWIPPGGKYPLTIQLRCVSQQEGLLQQWLLVMCIPVHHIGAILFMPNRSTLPQGALL